MLGLIDRWFEPVRPSHGYTQRQYVVLALLIVAGALLRFWHLDYVGLHGDEDIMGLAARGIVAHGMPILPSDMLYLRAPVHTYLIAGSTVLFGDSEWSLRMPSAIVGSLCGLLAFLLAKRFLDPIPNLMFVALMTFLPAMLEISQTARMYVFLVAGVQVFGILLFRWERQGTIASFLWALLGLLIAVQFHLLAVFAAPLLLYPGLANRSEKQLLQGAGGLVLAAAFSKWFGWFANQDYPDESERLIIETDESRSALEMLIQDQSFAMTAVSVVAVVLAVILLGTVGVGRRKELLPAAILLSIGAAACALLQYHIGSIALLFGSIIWFRAGAASNSRLLMLFGVVAIMTLTQLFILHGTGEFSGRKIIGALVGAFSVWPTLRMVEFSPIAAGILVAGFGFALYRLARGYRVPVYFLFFGLAVWAPLVLIGLFRWHTATRYQLGLLPFFLLSAVASATYLVQRTEWGARIGRRMPAFAAGASILVVVAAINPIAAWQTAQNSYLDHPDHAGAAEFIRQLSPGQPDIVIAEDPIVQTYYLGQVNYRLQSTAGARWHSLLKDGVLYDQYTGVPVIGSGQELEALLARNTDRNVYVISSAQVSDSLMRRNRGNGIAEALDSDLLEIIYVGRDRATTIWKLRR
jgi:hypothetical protein